MPNREDVARRVRWPYVKWLFGCMNAVAMVPQLVQLARTHQTAGISIVMFWVILAVQIGYSLDGFFGRNRMIMWSLAAASLVTTAIIVQYYAYR